MAIKQRISLKIESQKKESVKRKQVFNFKLPKPNYGRKLIEIFNRINTENLDSHLKQIIQLYRERILDYRYEQSDSEYLFQIWFWSSNRIIALLDNTEYTKKLIHHQIIFNHYDDGTMTLKRKKINKDLFYSSECWFNHTMKIRYYLLKKLNKGGIEGLIYPCIKFKVEHIIYYAHLEFFNQRLIYLINYLKYDITDAWEEDLTFMSNPYLQEILDKESKRISLLEDILTISINTKIKKKYRKLIGVIGLPELEIANELEQN